MKYFRNLTRLLHAWENYTTDLEKEKLCLNETSDSLFAHQFVILCRGKEEKPKNIAADDEKRKKKSKYFLARFSAPFFFSLPSVVVDSTQKISTKKYHRDSANSSILAIHSRLVFQTKLNWKWNGINKYFNRGIERDAEVVERDGTALLVGAFRVSNGLCPDWAVPHVEGIFISIFFHPTHSFFFPPLLSNLIWSIFNFDLVPIKELFQEHFDFRSDSRENVNGHQKLVLISDDWIEFLFISSVATNWKLFQLISFQPLWSLTYLQVKPIPIWLQNT